MKKEKNDRLVDDSWKSWVVQPAPKPDAETLMLAMLDLATSDNPDAKEALDSISSQKE